MEMMTKLEQIYADYYEKAAKVYKNASPVAGLFGMGDDPRRHHCHEDYYEAVGEWVEAFCQSQPTAEEATEAVRYILTAAAQHKGEPVYWYLYAAHGHAKPLIPLMKEADCRALAQWYDSAYPRLDRMPIQKEVYKLLHKGEKKKTGFFKSGMIKERKL